MRNSLKTLLLLLAALCAVGCTNGRVGVQTPGGLIYSNQVVPVTIKRDREAGEMTQIPEQLEMGRATVYAVNVPLFGVPIIGGISAGWGELALQDAMIDGNLAEVTYADARKLDILRIFSMVELQAYGPRSPSLLREAPEPGSEPTAPVDTVRPVAMADLDKSLLP